MCLSKGRHVPYRSFVSVISDSRHETPPKLPRSSKWNSTTRFEKLKADLSIKNIRRMRMLCSREKKIYIQILQFTSDAHLSDARRA